MTKLYFMVFMLLYTGASFHLFQRIRTMIHNKQNVSDTQGNETVFLMDYHEHAYFNVRLHRLTDNIVHIFHCRVMESRKTINIV